MPRNEVTGFARTISVMLGLVSFILFMLSISVFEGWLPESDLENISAAGWAVFGVIAGAGAIGAYESGV